MTKTYAGVAVPDGWPEQFIICKHCGLHLTRIDMPPPEGPTMQGQAGWLHANGIGVFCPAAVDQDQQPLVTSAEPSDFIAALFKNAIAVARKTGPK